MARRLSERTQAVLFLVILVVGIAGLYGWVQATQPPPVPPGTVRDVSLLIDGGTWTTEYGPVTTTSNTPFLLLLEASQRLGFRVMWQNYTTPPGVFVLSINGTANPSAGAGWQYWVGTTYGNVAANLVPLSDGDHVAWRCTTDQGGA